MKPLDNNNAVPLYEQMMMMLRERLENHVLDAGEKLPSEAELCKSYGVSRITVRRAIDELVEEGYLEKKQGNVCYPETRGCSGHVHQRECDRGLFRPIRAG